MSLNPKFSGRASHKHKHRHQFGSRQGLFDISIRINRALKGRKRDSGIYTGITMLDERINEHLKLQEKSNAKKRKEAYWNRRKARV